ncbi:MAG: ABC transporter ATP-binding protein, partial [Pseudomonadales bacterium]
FLILDEPSNGLDPTQIHEMRLLIQRLAEQATVILSTHIMQEVNAICDRALILRNGRLVVDEHLATLKQTASIRVRTQGDADLAALLSGSSQLGQVERLEQGGEWRIGISGERDLAVAEVAQSLVQAGLPVYHLAPEVRDLETIFAEVNNEEQQDAA